MRAIPLLLFAAVPTLARADVVHDWNNVALAAIQHHAAPPPVAARALAMTHVAIFDAVNSIAPTHQPFRIQIPNSAAASPDAATAQAAFRVLVHLYPADEPRLQTALAPSMSSIPDGPAKSAGIRLGNIAAANIINWRRDDGSARSVPFAPGTQPGQWRPTPPDYKPALLPNWPAVAPFGIAYASQFRPPFPPELSSAEYARDFEEVRLLGAANSTARDANQTQIAHFWADGPGTVTPPGHWNRIAQSAARSRNLSLHENARLFALLNVALADAAIVCWDMKYACNFWRPVTAVHEADTDGNPQTTRDPTWRPLLDTPPFPSCTSGHSTFSGAAAQILFLFFGRDDIAFTDTAPRGLSPFPESAEEKGTVPLSDNGFGLASTRSYATFSQAAEEAGRSRIYAGIHFQFDNRSGLESGRALAQYIFERHMKPRDHTTPLQSYTAAKPIPARPITRTEYLAATSGWTSASDSIATARTNTAPTQITVTRPTITESVPVVCYEPVIYTYPHEVTTVQPTAVYDIYAW
jgi:hypothetical protein